MGISIQIPEVRRAGQRVLFTVLLATLSMPSARAQGYGPATSPVSPAAYSQVPPAPMPGPDAGPPAPVGAQGGYVHLGSSMYPSPKPNIPIWTGATFIPTPALAPHEMLYPHTYKSLHGPYYHRVVGTYMWTPFGVRSHEKWELQGTMVKVKYRSQPSIFHPFHPPRISTNGGPWY